MTDLQTLHTQLKEAIAHAEEQTTAYGAYHRQLRRAVKAVERAQKAMDKLEELGARGEARTASIPHGEEVKAS